MERRIHDQRILKPNKRYRIYVYNSEYGCVYTLYIIKKDGIIRIYKHDNNPDPLIGFVNDYDLSTCDFSKDMYWIDEGFLDIKLLMASSGIDDDGWPTGEHACYVILKDLNGEGRIVELTSKKTILKDFLFSDFRGATPKTIYEGSVTFNENGRINNRREIDDRVLRFINFETKSFALYSLIKGYIFGPQSYTHIDPERFGTILDEKLAIENDGEVLDLSKCERMAEWRVYHDKENDDYYLFLDEEGCMFHYMTPDERFPEKYELELSKEIYI